MNDRFDETWHRLREWTNGQTPSERLAAQILLHEGFKDLDPSHPLGGRDGGKDAICTKDGQKWLMAVYFAKGQKSFKVIKDKFLGDLKGVKTNTADALVFVTNQELSLSQRENLKFAEDIPIEIFHLERINAILDKPEMRDIRKQFLKIDFGEEEKSISTRYLLSLDIQRDCKLLQNLLDYNENSYLTDKWKSCFRENRSTWRDKPSQILLIQSINRDLIQSIQAFYEKLDELEEECRTLIELKLMAATIELKPKHGRGILCFETPPVWAEKYFTEEDRIALLNCKKRNAMKLKSLKETIRIILDSGNQIVDRLSLQ
jgi:hypothetical protein